MCRHKIEELIFMLRAMVKCSPCELELVCRRFNAFVFLDSGVKQLNEKLLGVTTDSLQKYDFLRNENIFNHPVLALECKLVGKDKYRIKLHALDIHKKEEEHKYLGCDECLKRGQKAVIDDMRTALVTILETIPFVYTDKSDECNTVYSLEAIGDGCGMMPQIKYDMFEFEEKTDNCFIGVTASFDFVVNLDCDNFYFKCK